MVRWLARVFRYLDRYFISRGSLPSLRDIGISCFRTKVFQTMTFKIRDAIIALINQDHDGNQVDKSLLKIFLDVYIECGIGERQRDFYEKDFEVYLPEETRIYYSRKASSWTGQDYSHVEDICHNYWSKAEECLKKDKEIISQAPLSRSERKLIEIVQHELFTVYSKQLLEMELSYSLALVKDNKMEDLSRMYCNHKMTQFLEPVANVFKEHIIAEGTALVSQGEDAGSNKASNEISAWQQVLVVQIIELHLKYLVYVTDCFSSHFFCFTRWNGKLTDEAVKQALEKVESPGILKNYLSIGSVRYPYVVNPQVVQLVAYVGDRDLFAEFYRRKLFRRLLVDQSVDEDCEKRILTKFKQQYGGYFTSKMETMISLPPAEDRRKMIEDGDRDRQFAIDASIVRIMKMRKVLSHQHLVAECIEQLSRLFKPEVRAIKKQIEGLIFHEYLERDKDNPTLMRYLA